MNKEQGHESQSSKGSESAAYPRRRFLQQGAAGAIGTWSLAQSSGLWANTASEPMVFPSSIMQASRAELDVPLYVLAGKLPTDAFGHAFVVGALPSSAGTPVVNGDGMIYRFDFAEGPTGLQLKSRIAKTPCFFADQAAAGSSLAFKDVGVVRRSPKLGVRNQANTAFLNMGERMLVTFDGGRPYEIDTESLELVSPVGRTDEWRSAMPSISKLVTSGGVFQPYLSGAHPAWDSATGESFFVNYQPALPLLPASVAILRWDGQGELERFQVKVNGRDIRIDQSMHQLALTANHIILMDTAFRLEVENILGGDKIYPELWDTALYIVRRADLKAGQSSVEARRLLIPREIAHFVADFDDSQGQIVLHLTHGSAWLTSEYLRKTDKRVSSREGIRPELTGMLLCATDQTPMARYVIDAASLRISDARLLYDEDFTWSVNLYTHNDTGSLPEVEHMYWTSVGFDGDLLSQRAMDLEASYKYRKVAVRDLPFAQGKPASLFRVNTKSLDRREADGFVFPSGRAVSSPTFVQASGRSGPMEGYILVTVVSDDILTQQSSGDEVWLFDAKNLAQGPICRLGHPLLDFAYTLHSCWRPSIGPRTANYHVDVRTDFQKLVQAEGPEVSRFFNEKVYPHFT